LNNIKVEGKGGISATIIADSIAHNGQRITTFELEYHRYILAELNTHRLFSRNSMSSRAVPVESMISNCKAVPIHWGKNKSGMQADGETGNLVEIPLNVINSVQCKTTNTMAWDVWKTVNTEMARAFNRAGYHKQICNRPLEAFQMMKTVLTSTEFDNFFWLRCDKDAQPEIEALATCMKTCIDQSTPETLNDGEWHTPYVDHSRDSKGDLRYTVKDDKGKTSKVTLEQALSISSSSCAQVSYRNINNTFDKAMSVYERLGVGTNKIHASAFEHCATPTPTFEGSWKEVEGITHEDRKGQLWSGNFKGFIQYRQLLNNHTCNNYKEGV